MLECQTCGAVGDASFNTNANGDSICNLCGTQSFQESRNETQDLNDMGMDIASQLRTLKRKANKKKHAKTTMQEQDTPTKIKSENASQCFVRLADCLCAVQLILKYQANELIKNVGFPKEYASVVKTVWFRFLDAWSHKNNKPLLCCFTESLILVGDKKSLHELSWRQASSLQSHLLDEWDAIFSGSQSAADETKFIKEEPDLRARNMATQEKYPQRLLNIWPKFEHFSLLSLLGILVLASRILQIGVLPCDFTRWIMNGKLPYHNMFQKFPKDLRTRLVEFSGFFDTNQATQKRFSSARVAYHAMYLHRHLELRLPPLNLSMIGYNICQSANFPTIVFRNFQWLVHHFAKSDQYAASKIIDAEQQDDIVEQTNHHSGVEVAAFVIAAVKLSPNWHKWIYQRTSNVSIPYNFSASLDMPSKHLPHLIKLGEQVLVRDKETIPAEFTFHVQSLRSDHTSYSDSRTLSESPRHHLLYAYLPRHEHGIIVENDADIEAAMKQSTDSGLAQDEPHLEYFYPFYTSRVQHCFHPSYEFLLELLCEHIRAPISNVLPSIRIIDVEIQRRCQLHEEKR